MNVGLCTIAFSADPIERVLDLARRTGFDGVEIWGKAPHTRPAYDAERVAGVRKMVADRGLDVAALGSYVTVLRPNFHEDSANAIKTAQGLGAPLVRIWAPEGKPGSLSPQDYARAVEQLRTFCDQAAGIGATLAIEAHDQYIAEDSRSLLALIGDVGRANLKVCWQPSWRPDAEDFYESLDRLLPHVAHVHAQNFHGAYARRAYIRDGDVDYALVADMLRRAGYRGYMQVEFVGKDEPEAWLAKDCEFLREIGRE